MRVAAVTHPRANLYSLTTSRSTTKLKTNRIGGGIVGWKWPVTALVLAAVAVAAWVFSSFENRDYGLSLVVSRGLRPEEFLLPDAVGFSGEWAAARFREQGLVVQIERVRGEGRPGDVIRQRPLSGSRVRKGDRVTLYTNVG